MSYFIEIEGWFVNVDKIVAFECVEREHDKYTVIYLDATTLERIYTDITPEEIIQKIHKSVIKENIRTNTYLINIRGEANDT